MKAIDEAQLAGDSQIALGRMSEWRMRAENGVERLLSGLHIERLFLADYGTARA
jgi:hypothetical protein